MVDKEIGRKGEGDMATRYHIASIDFVLGELISNPRDRCVSTGKEAIKIGSQIASRWSEGESLQIGGWFGNQLQIMSNSDFGAIVIRVG